MSRIAPVLVAAVAAFFVAAIAGAGPAPSGLSVVSATERTVTVGWTKADHATGYTFYRDGVRSKSTGGPNSVSTRFSVGYGSHTLGVESKTASGLTQLSTVTVENRWRVTATTYPPPPVVTPPPVPPTPLPPGTLDMGAAYRAAQPGSTLIVPCGSYGPQTVTGQAAGPVVFRAAQPHCVVIVGSNASDCFQKASCGLTLGTNNGSQSGNAPSGLTLDGIDVNGTVFGWYVTGPPTTGFVFKNGRVFDTSDAGAAAFYLYSFVGALIQDTEVGPLCCNADGIDMAIPREGAPSPSGTLDNVNVHDIYDSCRIMAAALPGVPCSGTGFEDPDCASCAHVDGTQWYGGSGTIKNSTFTRINPGGNTGQGIFFSTANGGLTNGLQIVGNTLGTTPNNTLSIGGSREWVSGTINISGNHVDGNIRLYGDKASNGAFTPGVKVTVSNNVANVYQTTLGNGCDLILSDGSQYRPVYSGNVFGNRQCETG